MVATCGLKQSNQIHVVEFAEDTAEVACRQVLSHNDEVWLLGVSPSDPRNIVTYSSGKSSQSLRLWRNAQPDAQEGSLEQIGSLTDDETPLTAVKSVLWDPHMEGNIVVADSEGVHVFQGTSSAGGVSFTRQLMLHVGQRCSGACLDPHHAHQISTVDETHLKTWDLRANRLAFKKDNAHLFGARDVDYNPNVQHQVLTTGEDAALRFWDLRHLSKCLLTMTSGHHHWAVRARYNSHHDQLILSCGTDSAVSLWRAGSVSPARLGTESSNRDTPDGLVKRFEEHEDSCYSCCWSAADPWVFASVSYDGKLVVNRVPSEERYRILL